MNVAIVVPCRNELNYIVRCVESALIQEVDGTSIKVYVVDGLSDDGTRELLQKTYVNNDRVFIIDNDKRTTPFALNAGIKAAAADVSIIFGAHAVMHTDYVSYCLDVLQNDHSVACVGGVIANVNENSMAQVISECMSSSFGVGNAHFRTGNAKGEVDTVAFGAYRTKVFDEIGYFNESLTRNQDDELNFRIIKAGYKIFLDHQIRSDYFVRGSIGKLARQYFQYGYWKVYVNTLHHTITTWRQLVPFVFVSYLLSAAIIGFIKNDVVPILIIPLLVYLLLSFFISFRLGRGVIAIAQRMVIFFILHTTYGWGYLRGVLEFLIFRRKPNNRAELSSR